MMLFSLSEILPRRRSKDLQLVHRLCRTTSSGEDDKKHQGRNNACFTAEDVARFCPGNDETCVCDQVAGEDPSQLIIAF